MKKIDVTIYKKQNFTEYECPCCKQIILVDYNNKFSKCIDEENTKCIECDEVLQIENINWY